MAEHWIDASKAIEIVPDPLALCSRLHAGLISARAALLVVDDKEEQDALIPKQFWWAEGHSALHQNWRSGDFETWIDQKINCKAFGVKIALSGLTQMLAFEQRALVSRSLSVAGDPDWISAREALRIAIQASNANVAGKKIIEMARLGFISGRAVQLEAYRGASSDHGVLWEQREWNVEPWYWQDFTAPSKSTLNWELGNFSGSGEGPTGIQYVILSGVHFHRKSLAALESAKASLLQPESQKRGRKPEYDWGAASSSIWGRLHRGEFLARTQADIEGALIDALSKGDKSPGESTVRPHAKLIWEEYQKP